MKPGVAQDFSHWSTDQKREERGSTPPSGGELVPSSPQSGTELLSLQWESGRLSPGVRRSGRKPADLTIDY